MIEIEVINKLIELVNSLDNFEVNYTQKTTLGKCNVEIYLLDNNSNLVVNYENSNISNNSSSLNLVLVCKMITKKGNSFELKSLKEQYEYANKLKYAISTNALTLEDTFVINDSINLEVLECSFGNINMQYSTIDNNEMIFSLTTTFNYNYRFVNA